MFIKYFHILFLILFLIKIVHCKKDPIVLFSTHTVITPKYYDKDERQINLDSSSNDELDCNRIKSIKLNNRNTNLLTLKVFVNSQFLSSKYFETYQSNGSKVVDNLSHGKANECFFHGNILNQKLTNSTSQITDQLLALNLFRSELNGFISFNDKLFFIHYHDDLKKTVLFDNDDSIEGDDEFKCGFDGANHNSEFTYKLDNQFSHHVIDKRSTSKKIHGVYQQNTQTRFVELVIVNDHKLFLDYKRDKDRLINRSKSIANVVNTLYNQLNVFIILVGVEVWTEHDEIEITQNGDETLNKFLAYRKDKLLKQYYNDNAQLLTNITFKDNVVGKALKGPICTVDYSGGVNSDHNRLIDVVATTVAHELFHNFGGEHDPVDAKDKRICTCKQSKCIMSASSGSITPRYFSNCSIESFKEIYLHGMDNCLKNLPSRTLSSTCGNAILEDDEECDCGSQENCSKNKNKCCDFRTCKLKVNATCGTGACCDLNTCTLFKEEDKHICRLSTGFCDLTEFCNGQSEFCPPDIYVHNALKCSVDGDEAYCFNGKCQSHRSQCQMLFGETAEVSIDRCYQENANNASQAANCGVEISKFGSKRFKSCKRKDIYCGRIHCLPKAKDKKLEYGLDSAATQSQISRNGTVICHTAVIDLGMNIRDPGLVENGVKCGDNRMCLDQQCVEVASSGFCKFDCNNNGICNSLGECHCFDGYLQPYCTKFSFLSSFIFFLVLCSLIAIAVGLLHHYKDQIQTWWIVKQRTSAIKKRAKSTSFKLDKSKTIRNRDANINFDLKNLEISSPIPISTSNTTATNHLTLNPTKVDYTNENINRLWESNTDIRPETNKFVQLPNQSTTSTQKPIVPVRKAPPRPNQSTSLCNKSNNISQSNRVAENNEKFDV